MHALVRIHRTDILISFHMMPSIVTVLNVLLYPYIQYMYPIHIFELKYIQHKYPIGSCIQKSTLYINIFTLG